MRPREILNAEYFIKWFNQKYNLDFIIDVEHKDQDSSIDVLAKSSIIEKRLKIQNVAYRDGNIYKYGKSNIPNFRPVGILSKKMTDEERKQSIINCIQSKKNKYPSTEIQNLILLIEITIPRLIPEQIIKFFPRGINTKFSGVYFVCLPIIIHDPKDKYATDGFVFPLKDYEFTDEEIKIIEK